MRIILCSNTIPPLHYLPPIKLLHNIPSCFWIFFTSSDIPILNNKSRLCRIQNSRDDRVSIVRITYVLSNTSYQARYETIQRSHISNIVLLIFHNKCLRLIFCNSHQSP